MSNKVTSVSHVSSGARPFLGSHVAAWFLMLAGVQYLVLEAIAASAWHHPAYNYAVNYISDLGNPVLGDRFDDRIINSPLNVVMDTAFIAQGVLFIAAAVLLSRRIPGRARIVLLVMAILHGIGVTLVGTFHESAAAAANGLIVIHLLGAFVTIASGNVIAILIGIIGRQLSGSPWYRATSIILGIIGLASFVLLEVDKTLANTHGGIPERIAVYTIIVWEVITGIVLLAPRKRVSHSADLTLSQA